MNILNKRMDWIDIIKGLCILFVVLFHVDYITNIKFVSATYKYLGILTGIFEVTLFYCVAGITLNNKKIKNTKEFIKNKFKKIYVKTIIIGIIAVLLHNVFIKIGFYNTDMIYEGKLMNYYSVGDIIKKIFITLFLGNREVVLGAMWFVYTLFMDLIGIAILDWGIDRIKIIENKREMRLLVTFFLMNLSILFSNVIGITIPRFSNTMVGLFLLDGINYLVVERNINFNNKKVFFAACILFFLAPFYGGIGMNTNSIPNPAFLMIYVLSAMYTISFISKKISNICIGKILSFIGSKSYSIMAFHMIGFKFATVVLNSIGMNYNVALLKPLAPNLLLLIYYVLFGITVPIAINYVINKLAKIEI